VGVRTKSDNELNKYKENSYPSSLAINMTKAQAAPGYSYGHTNNGYFSSSKALNNEPTVNSSSFSTNADDRAKAASKQHEQAPVTSRSPSRLENNTNHSLNMSNVKSNLQSTVSGRNQPRATLSPPTRLVYANAAAAAAATTQNNTPNGNYTISSTNFNYDVQAAKTQAKAETASVYDNIDNDLLVSRMLNTVQQGAGRPAERRDEFRISAPGACNEIVRPTAAQLLEMDLEVEAFEPSPYNIMSDPIIAEQFKKLYEEDEYFRQIHRKCVEWLVKYVFPEIEREREKAIKQ
jgi:hypothetical protein